MLATNLTTADGLRIYDLEPQAAELTAIAGPEGLDCSAIDMDALPAGCRWVTDEEWSAACERAELLAGIIAGREISEARLARLREAAELGATAEVLAQIRDAVRVSRTAYVMLTARGLAQLIINHDPLMRFENRWSRKLQCVLPAVAKWLQNALLRSVEDQPKNSPGHDLNTTRVELLRIGEASGQVNRPDCFSC